MVAVHAPWPFAIVHIYWSVYGLGCFFGLFGIEGFLPCSSITATTSVWTEYSKLRDMMDNINMYATPEENARLADPDPEFAEVCYRIYVYACFQNNTSTDNGPSCSPTHPSPPSSSHIPSSKPYANEASPSSSNEPPKPSPPAATKSLAQSPCAMATRAKSASTGPRISQRPAAL